MGMDLVTLLAKCSPLLDACIGGDIAVFRILRLVSKEARQVALQAPLSGYVVTLRGEGRDTKDGVAGPLLIHTRLQDLSVCLHLSGVQTGGVVISGVEFGIMEKSGIVSGRVS